MRYAVVYLKGGVGKTTLAAHLATHLARSQKTLLIDGDPQESAATWATWRREQEGLSSPTTVRLRGNSILDEGMRLQEGFDHVVIDAGGRDGAGLRNALLLAERVIVPLGNSGLDAALLDEFMERIEEARRFNPGLEYRVLLNKINSSASVEALLELLKDKKVQLLTRGSHKNNIENLKPIKFGDRQVYARAISEGLTADEYRPKNAAATHELKQFYLAVESWT